MLILITLSIVVIVINAVLLGYKTDKFPVTIVVCVGLLSFLLLTIYSGLKSKDGNRGPDIIFLITASICMFLAAFNVIRFVQGYLWEFIWIVVVSIIYLLLYVTYLLFFFRRS